MEQAVAYLDILGFSNYIEEDTPGALDLFSHYTTILRDKIIDIPYTSYNKSLQDLVRQGGIDSFDNFLPLSDSIFISSSDPNLFIKQIGMFILGCFLCISHYYDAPENKDNPCKIKVNGFEINVYPTLFRGGISFGEVYFIEPMSIVDKKPQKIKNLAGKAVLEAVRLEKIVKGPRIILNKECFNKLNDDTKRYVQEIKEKKDIYEILWPAFHYKLNNGESELIHFNELFRPAVNLWLAFNHTPYAEHYFNFLKLIIYSTIKIFKNIGLNKKCIIHLEKQIKNHNLEVKIPEFFKFMEQKVIKPYHLFNYQGTWCVINIEEMFASTIDDATAVVIEKITAEPTIYLEFHIEEKLKKLELLSEGGGETSKLKKEVEIEDFPVVNMSLFLTQSCNLKCIYCYGEGGEYGTGGNMEEKTAFQAVDWLLEQSGKIKKLHVGFFGGEPFLNFPLMKTVVEYTKKRVQEMGKEVGFHATTNATLLDDEIISFIKEHQIIVPVSFDGLKELQDTQRPYANGEGSYDSIVPRIKKLLKALPETHGHAVIVGNTDPQLVKDAMQEIGFSEVSIMPASKSLFTEKSNKTKPARDTQHILQAMEHEAETWINLIKIKDREALKNFKARSGLYQGLISLLHNSKIHHACGAGLSLIAVSSSGDIYLCHRFVGRKEYKLGSIFDKSLNRKEYQKSPIKNNKLCTSCFARYYCAGGCKHDNVGSCGSVSTPSEDMCRIKCRELELAAAIICRLAPEDKAFLIEQDIFPPKPCPLDF